MTPWEPDERHFTDREFEVDHPFWNSFGFLIVGCALLLMMFLGLASIFMVMLQYPILWLVAAGIALWAVWWVNKPNI